jgi:hypothetical protein
MKKLLFGFLGLVLVKQYSLISRLLEFPNDYFKIPITFQFQDF